MMDDFKHFLETRRKAAQAYVNGDFAPLSRIVAETSLASFFSPMGDVTEGADTVADRYGKDAGTFDKDSTSDSTCCISAVPATLAIGSDTRSRRCG
jgi:hypothetical protein